MHTQELEAFRRSYPEIARHVRMELLEQILEVKTRPDTWSHKGFNYLASFAFVATALFFLMPSNRMMMFRSIWLMNIVVFGLLYLNYRNRHRHGPFSLTRMLTFRNGILSQDLWLTGISYEEMAATEAAIAFLRKPQGSGRVMSLIGSVGVPLFILWILGMRGWELAITCVALGLVGLLFQYRLAPMYRVKVKLREVYSACSVEMKQPMPFVGGPASNRGNLPLLFDVLFGLIIFFCVLLIFFAFRPTGKAASSLFLIFFSVVMPTFSMLFTPRQIRSTWKYTISDGNARFRQLAEKVAAGN